MNIWPEFENPYRLLLIALVLAGIFWRNRPYFVYKAHSPFSAPKDGNIKDKGRRALEKIRFGLPYFFVFLALLAIIGALADPTRSYQSYVEELKTHRIFVAIDSSQSMTTVKQGKPESTFVSCQKNSEFYPRIEGSCKAVRRLVDDVEEFSRKKGAGGEKDKVGIIQFAGNSYVISYPTNDYASLREKTRQIVFREKGGLAFTDAFNTYLGYHTNIHLAVWDMLLMTLERNLQKDAGGTFVSGKELRELARALSPGPDFSPPKELKEKLEKIKEEITDATLIVITDAQLGQMDSALSAGPYSLRNELKLAAFLGLPVYFISTDEFHLEMKQLALETGGDFVVVRGELFGMAGLVSDILKKRFASTAQRKVIRRESYSERLAFMALIFLFISLLLKKTISRTLTDI